MTVEILSSYAGIIEAIVVVVSLVYLAVQMRQNTLMMRAQASQATSDTFNSLYPTIIPHGSVWRNGMKNIDDLNEDDKFTFFMLCTQYSRAMETSFSQYKLGALDIVIWEGICQASVRLCNAKGYRQYWEARSFIHSSAYRTWIEEDVFTGEVSNEYVNSLKGKAPS